MPDIIEKIRQADLRGKGGAGFPTALKWEAVKYADGNKKYVVCNAAEGEPGVFKDGFILEKFPKEVIEGIKLGLEAVGAESAYIYIRKDYLKRFGKKLKRIIGESPIILFEKRGGYIAGEETALIESIEGKIAEPRIRPPYPSESGLFNCPTLINNIETFYWVCKINKGEYKKARFYSISGDVKNKGIFELPENHSIIRILKETGNLPKFDFFVQIGGGIAGEIFLSSELEGCVSGSGAIIIFNRKKTNSISLLKNWLDFLVEGNCDKCVPCREGIYRLRESLKNKKINKEIFEEIGFLLETSSFCTLGRESAILFKSLIKKLDL